MQKISGFLIRINPDLDMSCLFIVLQSPFRGVLGRQNIIIVRLVIIANIITNIITKSITNIINTIISITTIIIVSTLSSFQRGRSLGSKFDQHCLHFSFTISWFLHFFFLIFYHFVSFTFHVFTVYYFCHLGMEKSRQVNIN